MIGRRDIACRRADAALVAPLLLILALATLAACTQKRDAVEISKHATARAVVAPPRCGPGLAAEDLAGNCRDKDCPTMGALEAEPPRPPERPCPKVTPRAAAKPAAKAQPK
jgi:hypothetical protein